MKAKFVKAVMDKPSRESEIKSILLRGNIAVFTSAKGIIKKLGVWNPNSDGDLTAYFSTGKTNLVCWEAAEYTITEEKPPK